MIGEGQKSEGMTLFDNNADRKQQGKGKRADKDQIKTRARSHRPPVTPEARALHPWTAHQPLALTG